MRVPLIASSVAFAALAFATSFALPQANTIRAEIAPIKD
jgi:hypothetical protein